MRCVRWTIAAAPNRDAIVTTPASAPSTLSRRVRLGVSVLVIGHLIAIFGPPLAFQTRGRRGVSPSVMTLITPIQRYAEMTYLNRGYAFFAPDPGPSHLVRVDRVSGDRVDADRVDADSIVFPNLDQQQPRLRYHRYFMLAEFLHESYQPALPAETAILVGTELTGEELQMLRQGRARYEAIAASMARHLGRRMGGDVTLTRLEHQLPDFVGFQERGLPLDAPESYIRLDDIPITMETLVPGGVGPLPLPAAVGESVGDFGDALMTRPPVVETVQPPPGVQLPAEQSVAPGIQP